MVPVSASGRGSAATAEVTFKSRAGGSNVVPWSRVDSTTANPVGNVTIRGAAGGQFGPGRRRIITSSRDQTIKLWDASTGEEVFTLRGHTGWVLGIAISYFANTASYRAWVRLALKTDGSATILFSFHAVGFEFRGVLAVSATFFRRHETEDGQAEAVDLTPLCEEPFQLNYLEPESSARGRFRPWLDRCLARGLEVWRGGL